MDRLRKRREFLAAARAERRVMGSVLVQARHRGDQERCRVGITVTKKTAGGAVARNRLRRRLRAVAEAVLPQAGRAGHDYVLIARATTMTRRHDLLIADVRRALDKLHRVPKRASGMRSGTRPDTPPDSRTCACPAHE